MPLIWTISGKDKQSIIFNTKVRQNEKEVAKKRFCRYTVELTTTYQQGKIKKRKIFSEKEASKRWG